MSPARYARTPGLRARSDGVFIVLQTSSSTETRIMSLASWFLNLNLRPPAGSARRSRPHARRAARRRPFAPRLEALEDRAVPSVNLVETELNNAPSSANGIDRMPATQVIVSGSISTLGDRDWFRLELQQGDV